MTVKTAGNLPRPFSLNPFLFKDVLHHLRIHHSNVAKHRRSRKRNEMEKQKSKFHFDWNRPYSQICFHMHMPAHSEIEEATHCPCSHPVQPSPSYIGSDSQV